MFAKKQTNSLESYLNLQTASKIKEALMNKPGCRINQRFLNASAFSILLSKDAAELFKQTLDDNHANACILHQDPAAHLIFLLPEI